MSTAGTPSFRAILAHLYLAWIHPFGDGNGRTARLSEFQLLIEAGLPTPAFHLLSNYYNRTRTRYYQVPQGQYTPTAAMRRLTAELAEMYSGKHDKTVSRDINALDTQKLVHRTKVGVRPLTERMMAFVPLRQVN